MIRSSNLPLESVVKHVFEYWHHFETFYKTWYIYDPKSLLLKENCFNLVPVFVCKTPLITEILPINRNISILTVCCHHLVYNYRLFEMLWSPMNITYYLQIRPRRQLELWQNTNFEHLPTTLRQMLHCPKLKHSWLG